MITPIFVSDLRTYLFQL